jgi:hypothetical protein
VAVLVIFIIVVVAAFFAGGAACLAANQPGWRERDYTAKVGKAARDVILASQLSES